MITRLEGLEHLVPLLVKTLKQHYPNLREFKDAVVEQLKLDKRNEENQLLKNKQGQSIQDGW